MAYPPGGPPFLLGGLLRPYDEVTHDHFQSLLNAKAITLPDKPAANSSVNVDHLVTTITEAVVNRLWPLLHQPRTVDAPAIIEAQALPPGESAIILIRSRLSHWCAEAVTPPAPLPMARPPPSHEAILARVAADPQPMPHSASAADSHPSAGTHVFGPSPLSQQALQAMQHILGTPTVTWKTETQRLAMLAILEHQADVVAIMPTGSGKSMLMVIPAVLDSHSITVGILPLKSLLMDYQRKLTQQGIPHEVWTGTDGQQMLTGHVNLILVLVDQARKDAWRQALSILHQRKPVKRIIFDEAHFALTNDGFRAALTHTYTLRQENAQLVLLSATIPPGSEEALKHMFQLTMNVRFLRMSTNRPEIMYVTKSCPLADLVTNIQHILNTVVHSFAAEDRALIFVGSIEHGRLLSQALQCELYQGSHHPNDDLHSPSDDERRRIYSNWATGIHRILVATSAFSAGNDYPSVRLVIHAGWLFDMVDYIQGHGRAGRDHRSAASVILTVQAGHPPPPQSVNDHQGRYALWHMLFGPGQGQCIRYLITLFNDGSGIHCSDNPSNQICSRCRAHPSSPPASSLVQESTPPGLLAPAASAQPLSVNANSSSSSSPHLKRSSSPPDNVFVKAQRIADARHISSKQQEDDYIQRFHHAAHPFAKHCVFCMLLGPSDATADDHNLMQCPLLLTGPSPFTVAEYVQWRKRIKYSNTTPNICYGCHVPLLKGLHGGDAQQGHNRLGCSYPDMIAPLAYYIFHTPSEHQAAAGHFHLASSWTTLASFTTWLQSRSVPNHFSNLSALFLWFATSHYAN